MATGRFSDTIPPTRGSIKNSTITFAENTKLKVYTKGEPKE
jgi:hypothetical protein